MCGRRLSGLRNAKFAPSRQEPVIWPPLENSILLLVEKTRMQAQRIVFEFSFAKAGAMLCGVRTCYAAFSPHKSS